MCNSNNSAGTFVDKWTLNSLLNVWGTVCTLCSHRRLDHGATSSQGHSSHPAFSNHTTPSNADAFSGEVVTSRRRNLPRIQGSSSCSNPRPGNLTPFD